MDAVHTEQFGGCELQVIPDAEPESPREWDNLSEMVCWHRHYDLGDRKPDSQELEALERGGGALLQRYLRMCKGAVAFTWLGLLDHSGLHMWAGGGAHMCDPGGWDSGTVGFAYVTKARCVELGVDPENAEAQMLSEVKTFDQYLTGDVYGCVITDQEGLIGESCWGFFGYDYAVEEGKTMLRGFVESTYGIPMDLEV